MRGPTCIFWANLTTFSLQNISVLRLLTGEEVVEVVAHRAVASAEAEAQRAALRAAGHPKVRKAPSWPRSWANFSLL